MDWCNRQVKTDERHGQWRRSFLLLHGASQFFVTCIAERRMGRWSASMGPRLASRGLRPALPSVELRGRSFNGSTARAVVYSAPPAPAIAARTASMGPRLASRGLHD